MHNIKCENLYVSYGMQPVLRDLSFFANEGECLSILGENGTGKSTLLKCLLGLIKPDSGKIQTNGFTLSEVGYLPQQTVSRQNFPASVSEVVLSGCLNLRGLKPFYSKKERTVATENLEKVGALHLKKQRFCTLSGGQQQRVLLARALCCAKNLLVLDEPVAGLDPVAAQELYSVISALKNENLAVIMVSHDTAGALSVSERVLYMSNTVGDCFFGTKAEYLRSPYAKSFTEAVHYAE